jgi:hypothetical protein
MGIESWRSNWVRFPVVLLLAPLALLVAFWLLGSEGTRIESLKID